VQNCYLCVIDITCRFSNQKLRLILYGAFAAFSRDIFIVILAFDNSNNKWPKQLDKRPHCRHIWTVHWYSSGSASVHPTWVIHNSFGTSRVHNPNGISIGSAIFAQLSAKCRRACPGMSFPLKLAHWHGKIWTPNTWFLGPKRVHAQNGKSIGSAVFAGPPNMDGSIVFARLRQFAPPCNT